MARKIVAATIFIIIFLAGSQFAFSDWPSQTDLDSQLSQGFRGFAWGKSLADFKGMNFIFYGESTEGIRFYYRDKEDLTYQGIPLEKIRYGFYQDQFCAVILDIYDKPQWDKMRQILSEKYGPPEDILGAGDKESEQYLWAGKLTAIQLLYDKTLLKGGVTFSYFVWIKK